MRELVMWRYMALVLMVGVGMGCAGFGDSDRSARLVVQYAVYKYTAGDPIKAGRVRDAVDEALAILEGDASVTVLALKAAVLARVDMTKLDAADQFLANAVINEVTLELNQRVGEGALDGERLLQVTTVLQWVRDAAFTTALGGGEPV